MFYEDLLSFLTAAPPPLIPSHLARRISINFSESQAVTYLSQGIQEIKVVFHKFYLVHSWVSWPICMILTIKLWGKCFLNALIRPWWQWLPQKLNTGSLSKKSWLIRNSHKRLVTLFNFQDRVLFDQGEASRLGNISVSITFSKFREGWKSFAFLPYLFKQLSRMVTCWERWSLSPLTATGG